jgi:DDE superfamily endonuclease
LHLDSNEERFDENTFIPEQKTQNGFLFKGVLYCVAKSRSDQITAVLNGNDQKTREHLRVSYRTFIKLVRLLPKKHSGWANDLEMFVFLYWMACGCSYRVIGTILSISRTTICRIVHKLLDFFVINLKHLIKKPSETRLGEIGAKFSRRAGTRIFSNVVGAIDGSHVRIHCPVDKHDEYINHKKFYSIQLQAVCDSFGLFTDVFVGFPGSVHDTRVLKNSPIYRRIVEYPQKGYFLLGDSGYPCQLVPLPIITPYKNPNREQKKFNTCLSRARIIIECAFGMMKTRWRNIFNNALELEVENCVKVIFSACVLHNVCLLGNDFNPSELDEVPDGDTEYNFLHEMEGEEVPRDSLDATIFRDRLLHEFSNENARYN